MKFLQKTFMVVLVLLIAAGTVFAGGGSQAQSGSTGKGLIGVVMPTRSEERWI
ncbi:MAG: hypothetical protein LBC60_08335 [Spirochaetaceae bacterium]|jgi:putative multiple sugar transport system substrate-binding protein|nr:hypothetical protein [Spirochaetaceae bacterium]